MTKKIRVTNIKQLLEILKQQSCLIYDKTTGICTIDYGKVNKQIKIITQRNE